MTPSAAAARSEPTAHGQIIKHFFPDNADSRDYARSLDSLDPLRLFRAKFVIPSKQKLSSLTLYDAGVSEDTDHEEAIYFCGNSLGLQPKCLSTYLNAYVDTWRSLNVHGHFRQLEGSPMSSWQSLAEQAATLSEKVVGACPGEVGVANTLSVNLHLLMASFYRPTPVKNKILLEWKAFPSDHYAIESQIEWHGYNPKESMVLVEPDQDHTISTQKILSKLDEYADEIALVLLPGIQYYSGQLLDIETITAHAHSLGLTIGWDLAHAAGNVPLQLHEWDVDFATWCTYKYMNAGPGSISGYFINKKHGMVEYPEGADRPVFRPRLTGWYGGDKSSRFNMDNKFRPIPGAGGFQISNPSAIDLTSLCASLSVFSETSIEVLREKSLRITAYLQYLLLNNAPEEDSERAYRIITPLDPRNRGAQLSILMKPGLLETVGKALDEAGIVVDQRKPDVIRVAPAPLYNSYMDVWNFVKVFRTAVDVYTV